MIGTCGCCAFTRVDQHLGRRDHPALELVVGQAPGPAVENLQDIGARRHLPAKVLGRRLDQQIDQPLKSVARRDRPTRRASA